MLTVLACAIDKEGWNVFEKWGNWPMVGQEVCNSLYQPMCSATVIKCWKADDFCFCLAAVWRLLNFCVGGTVAAFVVDELLLFLDDMDDLGVLLVVNIICRRLSAFLWWQAFISTLLGVQLLIRGELSKSAVETQEQWTRLFSNRALSLGSMGHVLGGNRSTRLEVPLVFIGDKTKRIRSIRYLYQVPVTTVDQWTKVL